MEAKAQKIVTLIADYENNQMTVNHVLDWVKQFEIDDQEFILDELFVIFEKTYFSRNRCKQMLCIYVKQLAEERKYDNVISFLRDTVFLDLQDAAKSQKDLLALLEEILTEEYNLTFDDCGRTAKHFIYLDDVLSTGNTIYNDLHLWLTSNSNITPSDTNFEYLKKNLIKLSVCLICTHFWGQNNVEYRLMQNVDINTKKYIEYYRFLAVENHKSYDAALNNMVPINHQLPEVEDYLNSIEFATLNVDRAYRQSTQPGKYEKIFSSPENRDRLETIFLKKGIEILNNVQTLSVKQIRPLGYTIKSHKTFGLGTLFFTYRNIPNNCPIVFWWGSNNWHPLFVVKNRGRN